MMRGQNRTVAMRIMVSTKDEMMKEMEVQQLRNCCHQTRNHLIFLHLDIDGGHHCVEIWEDHPRWECPVEFLQKQTPDQ